MKIEPGVYYNIPFDDYMKWPYFHKSLVFPALRSAKHLKESQQGEKDTDAMQLGRLVDAMLLEPDRLDDFVRTPETYTNSKGKEAAWTLRSNTCKEELAKIIASGRTPISKEMEDSAFEIANGVKSNPAAVELLKNCKKQVSLVWEDPEINIICKGRLDCVGTDSITDLKTTRNAAKDSFSRDAARLGYHHQASMYVDGWKVLNGQECKYNIIAVENEPPYCCAVYELSEDSIEAGRIMCRAAMLRYKDYMENDSELKRGYSDFIEPLEVPRWVIERAYMEGDV